MELLDAKNTVSTISLTCLISSLVLFTAASTHASFSPIGISGIAVDEGNFDPGPTQAADDTLWMSYSHVAIAPAGNKQIETRLAVSNDAGLSWQDQGVSVNTPSSLLFAPPNNINAIAHEVSRLIYNPYAASVGADPWILLWHRYLSVYNGVTDIRLFEHGWIGLKSGSSPILLSNERKLFTGNLYNSINNGDPLGVPEYPLDVLYPAMLGSCLVFSEPGLLPQPDGVYISMLCSEGIDAGKNILLRCDHAMNNCVYRGELINNSEAASFGAFDGFSGSELVAVGYRNYLIVTPVSNPGGIYRGCIAFEITNLSNASLKRSNGVAEALLTLPPQGDFNGACAYHETLSGSGIMMSQAFISESPTFRLFASGVAIAQSVSVSIPATGSLILGLLLMLIAGIRKRSATVKIAEDWAKNNNLQ